jgi:hypothetical protein
MEEIFKNPLISGMFLVLLIAGGNWITSLFNRRKQNSDLLMLEEKQRVELQMQLDKVRLEGEIAEARRVEAARLETERLRLETANAQSRIAEKLEQTNTAQREALEKAALEQRVLLAAQTKAIADIAVVQDQTHAAVNSAKSALETTLQGVRNELKAAEIAAANAATVAALELASAKELARRDLLAKEEKITALTQQLTLLPTVLAAGSVSAPAGTQVTIPATPAQVVPVEEAPGVSPIIQP